MDRDVKATWAGNPIQALAQSPYAGRLLGSALCQGAAVHYVNNQNGVKDFDVWSFYAQFDDWLPGADPADAVRNYLAARRTESAKRLAAKAPILIDDRAGAVEWPVDTSPS